MISCSSSFASSTPATSLNETFTSVSATSFAFERPTDSSPPPKPPPRPPIIAREANIQMPTNSKGGRIHDTSVPSVPLSVAVPLYSTLCLASWLARSGGTCTVLNSVRPSFIFSVSVPRMMLPETVTCLTLPPSRYCWNSL